MILSRPIIRHLTAVVLPEVSPDNCRALFRYAISRSNNRGGYRAAIYRNGKITALHIYPWSLKVLDYPADKYHAQRDENRADCKTEDCP
ncbi:hypothetical protein AwEntero_29730 [Enterobacterales bacterium]|nr:hypothetical protein AwEntero_29730 [Enterobacterales bacterium]